MRSKDKVNINGQVEPAIYDRLRKISNDRGLSMIKTIEFLIDNYGEPIEPVLKPTATTKTLSQAILLPAKKEQPARFNLAEEMAKLRQQ